MTNEQQQSPIFCLDKLKKHLYNTIWGIKQLLTNGHSATSDEKVAILPAGEVGTRGA
jgi:hypothetical protein